MNQDLDDRKLELQRASFFRTRTESDSGSIVSSPYLGAPIASAFERLSRFEDPAVEIARLGVHEVHHVCWGIDLVDDDVARIDDVATWTRDGVIDVRSMAGGRCCCAPSSRVPRIHVAIGVAPKNAERFTEDTVRAIREAAASRYVSSIGSCGLDDPSSDAAIRFPENSKA